jgi:hypothetical protein
LCMLSDELILEKLEYTEKEKSELNEIEKWFDVTLYYDEKYEIMLEYCKYVYSKRKCYTNECKETEVILKMIDLFSNIYECNNVVYHLKEIPIELLYDLN